MVFVLCLCYESAKFKLILPLLFLLTLSVHDVVAHMIEKYFQLFPHNQMLLTKHLHTYKNCPLQQLFTM